MQFTIAHRIPRFALRLLWLGLLLSAAAAPAQSNVVTGDGALTITLTAEPGATMGGIYQNLLASFDATTRPDVLVIQGGVNDIFWYGQSQEALESKYDEALTYCVNYARSCGVRHIFIMELTPVIPAIVDVYSEYTARVAPVEPKIELLNNDLAGAVSRLGVMTIPVYTRFKNHWTTEPLSWCQWQASDSVHPSAIGNLEIGRAIANAIRRRALHYRPLRITLAGDSILAATAWPAAQQPAAWLRYFLKQGAAGGGWRKYQ